VVQHSLNYPYIWPRMFILTDTFASNVNAGKIEIFAYMIVGDIRGPRNYFSSDKKCGRLASNLKYTSHVII
jgi:hypothetical protein